MIGFWVTLYPALSDFHLWTLIIGNKCLDFKNVIGSSLKIDGFMCKSIFEYEGLVYTSAPLFRSVTHPLETVKICLASYVIFAD